MFKNFPTNCLATNGSLNCLIVLYGWPIDILYHKNILNCFWPC